MICIAVTDPLRTDAERDRYVEWLRRSDPDLAVSVLAPDRSPGEDLAGYHGLLLTGGGDVDPSTYGRSDALDLVSEVKPQRDRMEGILIDQAIRLGMPLLGICRGMQMVNVALGGTLIPDLVAAGHRGHRAREKNVQRHRVRVEGDTQLCSHTGVREGVVVSSHHQAVERPAEGLRVVARSDDGVIEAMEWADDRRRPRMLLVQWHPERMTDEEGPLSSGVREIFIQAARRYAGDGEVARYQQTHTQPEGER